MSDTTMTPDQFFDELDEIFGCDDGYINHLQRIKELKEKLNCVERQRDSVCDAIKELKEEVMMIKTTD